MNEHLSLSAVTLLTPRRPGLRAAQENFVDVLVRIQAPDARAPPAPAPRPPQALALVIDHSGSMGTPATQAAGRHHAPALRHRAAAS